MDLGTVDENTGQNIGIKHKTMATKYMKHVWLAFRVPF